MRHLHLGCWGFTGLAKGEETLDVKIKWEAGGLDRALTQAVRNTKNDVLRKARSVRCPEHGKTASVRAVDTREGDRLEIDGCCDALVKSVQRVIAA
jgi:hypothetical protein